MAIDRIRHRGTWSVGLFQVFPMNAFVISGLVKRHAELASGRLYTLQTSHKG
jgi:hypothetical protein